MKNIIILLLVSLFTISSCGKMKEKTKETINKGGEAVGKGGTEFISGVIDGVNKSLEVELVLSDSLKKSGLEISKYLVEDDSDGGKDNMLVIYFIFNEKYNGILTAKAFDKNGHEYGRCSTDVNVNKNEAKFIEFRFEKRSQIESKSKVIIE